MLAHCWNFATFPIPHKRLSRPVLRFKFLLLARMKDLGSCVFCLIYNSHLPTLYCASIFGGRPSWYILEITNDITNRRQHENKRYTKYAIRLKYVNKFYVHSDFQMYILCVPQPIIIKYMLIKICKYIYIFYTHFVITFLFIHSCIFTIEKWSNIGGIKNEDRGK